MRAWSMSLLLFVAFALGCIAGGVANVVIPSARAGTSPSRWEYTCFPGRYSFGGTFNEETLARMKEAGEKGFELATASGTNGEVLCFKRPMP